jgi:hypothetical protein
VASELPPSPFEPVVRDAACHVLGVELWYERLRRRLAKPDASEHAGRLVQRVHELLAEVDDGRLPADAHRRVRDAYAEAAAAVGLEAPPWH